MKLIDLSLLDAIKGIKQGDFSVIEYTKALIEQISSQADLNCFVNFCPETLLKNLEGIDRSTSKFAGVPVAIKDMLLTKGVETCAASKILKGFIPPYSAHVVELLEDAGAVCAGKTNQDEFAMGSSSEHSPFGPVLNPWDRSRVAGGSSGGSAAAVAAQLVPVSIGTDTGGSVRQPAAFCGVVGLKPTYGRVSRYGVIAYASSLDQVGVFARSVADCAFTYEAIAGWDRRDSTSVNKDVNSAFPLEGFDVSSLKIGLPTQYYSEGIDEAVRSEVLKLRDLLAKEGAEIKDVELPHTDAAIAAYYIIAPAEAASNLSRYDGVRYGKPASEVSSLEELYSKTRSEGFGQEVQRRILTGTYVLSKGYYDAYYRKAQKVRKLIANDFTVAFKDVDVLLTPVTPTTAFKVGQCVEDPLVMYLNDVFTVSVNLAGLPAISLPCGLDQNRLPVGVQLIGPAWSESKLLKIAASAERLIDKTFSPFASQE